MNFENLNLSSAMNTVSKLIEQGYDSFKVYKERGFWFVLYKIDGQWVSKELCK